MRVLDLDALAADEPEMRWTEFHSHDKNVLALGTSRGPVQIEKGEEFYIGAFGDAGRHRSSCVERGTLQSDADVLVTVDSRYVKGADRRETYCQRKQSAGHTAGTHVESDKTKATAPLSMDTWPPG